MWCVCTAAIYSISSFYHDACDLFNSVFKMLSIMLFFEWILILPFYIFFVRKFLLSHLAQIKYILPEGVQIEKILIHDEKTKCMKSEMRIGLLFDVVKYHHEESVYVALSNIFSSRLRDFNAKHPEVI